MERPERLNTNKQTTCLRVIVFTVIYLNYSVQPFTLWRGVRIIPSKKQLVTEELIFTGIYLYYSVQPFIP